ncbi:MAG: hypothetical protein U1D30_24870 [Planctomycetota bacterium]
MSFRYSRVFLASRTRTRWTRSGSGWTKGNPLGVGSRGKSLVPARFARTEPSTGEIRIASDDAFSLWINGRHVADGKGGQGYRFNLNGVVDQGINAIAVLVDNAEGKAGLLVGGEVRGQGGTNVPFDSGPEWVGTRARTARGRLDPTPF